jgi:hypothetical protein
VRFLHHYEAIFFSVLIGLALCLFFAKATQNPQMIPGPLQNVAEWAVEGLYNFIHSILGPTYTPRFFPFLATLFIYIFSMNLIGLIPFMDSPTEPQHHGRVRPHGVPATSTSLHYLGPTRSLDHLMGGPRDLISGSWCRLLPIHIMDDWRSRFRLCRLFETSGGTCHGGVRDARHHHDVVHAPADQPATARSSSARVAPERVAGGVVQGSQHELLPPHAAARRTRA